MAELNVHFLGNSLRQCVIGHLIRDVTLYWWTGMRRFVDAVFLVSCFLREQWNELRFSNFLDLIVRYVYRSWIIKRPLIRDKLIQIGISLRNFRLHMLPIVPILFLGTLWVLLAHSYWKHIHGDRWLGAIWSVGRTSWFIFTLFVIISQSLSTWLNSARITFFFNIYGH